MQSSRWLRNRSDINRVPQSHSYDGSWHMVNDISYVRMCLRVFVYEDGVQSSQTMSDILSLVLNTSRLLPS